ncbi:pilus assembly protein [Actinomyces lilanjuaniae]|uniref:pilus assembly protein n=1 Tax=Actinomyces lilanjuaniae TaxID=2321394 RepID=UPI001FA9A201|nr:pilus assembly protein [Actinomyces lilanjuaniae]
MTATMPATMPVTMPATGPVTGPVTETEAEKVSERVTETTTTTRSTVRPGRLLRRLGRDESGVLDIELIAFVPIVVLVLLMLLQGFLAVATVTSVSAAARDGARAAMLGRSATVAAERSLPSWVTLESVRDGCGSAHCVEVTARVPIGLPMLTTEHVTVSRTAYFPED